MRHMRLMQAGMMQPDRVQELQGHVADGQALMMTVRECVMEMQSRGKWTELNNMMNGGGGQGGVHGGYGGDWGGAQAPRTCHKCGMPGHIARECPNAPGEQRTCHVCGEGGHIARDCPQGPSRPEERACHVCGESGHLARDCPQSTCHNCGKPGHRAAECPGLPQL